MTTPGEKTSGANEKFWDENYRADRYLNADGTMVPLWEQVEIEENCRRQRFDGPNSGLKLRDGARFDPAIDGVKLRKDLPF